MIEIRWHGRGGQGSFTASKLLGIAASLYEGKYAIAFPSFGPERRGAPVLAFTKIDEGKIVDRSEVKFCDYIIILDESLFHESFIKDLKNNGRIIINTANKEKYEEFGEDKIVAVDASAIAMEILGRPITNTAMLGAFVGISGMISLESAAKGIEHYLEGATLEKNLRVLEEAYRKSMCSTSCK